MGFSIKSLVSLIKLPNFVSEKIDPLEQDYTKFQRELEKTALHREMHGKKDTSHPDLFWLNIWDFKSVLN